MTTISHTTLCPPWCIGHAPILSDEPDRLRHRSGVVAEWDAEPFGFAYFDGEGYRLTLACFDEAAGRSVIEVWGPDSGAGCLPTVTAADARRLSEALLNAAAYLDDCEALR